MFATWPLSSDRHRIFAAPCVPLEVRQPSVVHQLSELTASRFLRSLSQQTA